MNPVKNKIRFKYIQDLPVKITDWIGSKTSIALHTAFFIGIFFLRWANVGIGDILLILTTAVSLEAIYLSIFIQMTVNRNTQSLEEVEEDIDEIQEDVMGIEKDIDEIQVDVDKLEEEDLKDSVHDANTLKNLDVIQGHLQALMQEIQALKEQKK